MPKYCKYTFPVQGIINIDNAPPIHIDDLFLEFSLEGNELQTISITFPVTESSPEEREKHKNSNLWIHEPRANEIEEVVLQISSGFSIATSKQIDIPFSSRRVEWIENGTLLNGFVDLQGGPYKKKKTNKISQPEFTRSVLLGCIYKGHDPALTFYKRGVDDSLSHRHIEALYNFYFFLEILFGNGKFKQNQIREEFLKSEQLCKAIELMKEDSAFNQIASSEFVKKIHSFTASEILDHIIKTRGRLHHSTKQPKNYWHPEKQYYFLNEALLLHSICMHIAIRRYYEASFTKVILKATKKVKRCLRRNSKIRVVTK